jgi:glycosyltransferase involved in cell wall biosynthesis
MTAILVNARFQNRRLTGVERYAQEITRRFGNHVRLLVPDPGLQGAAGHFWEQVCLPARVGNRQMLWSPSNSGPLALRQQVVTIHDVGMLEHPEWFNPKFAAWYKFLLPRLARQVRLIVTVSEFSRQRIADVLGIPPERIVAIPNGVDSNHFRPRNADEIRTVQRRYGLPENYLLCVGTLEPRKNLPRLFQAWECLRPKYPDLKLVLVGAQAPLFRDRGFQTIPPEVQLTGYLNDEDLPAIYSGALLLVMPSIYEGFGLPVLEAMACRVPVVAAGGSAMPEVVGEAGCLVDPYSVDSIAWGIERLLADSSLRQVYASRGQIRAGLFSFDQSALATWTALQSVL